MGFRICAISRNIFEEKKGYKQGWGIETSVCLIIDGCIQLIHTLSHKQYQLNIDWITRYKYLKGYSFKHTSVKVALELASFLGFR